MAGKTLVSKRYEVVWTRGTGVETHAMTREGVCVRSLTIDRTSNLDTGGAVLRAVGSNDPLPEELAGLPTAQLTDAGFRWLLTRPYYLRVRDGQELERDANGDFFYLRADAQGIEQEYLIHAADVEVVDSAATLLDRDEAEERGENSDA